MGNVTLKTRREVGRRYSYRVIAEISVGQHI